MCSLRLKRAFVRDDVREKMRLHTTRHFNTWTLLFVCRRSVYLERARNLLRDHWRTPGRIFRVGSKLLQSCLHTGVKQCLDDVRHNLTTCWKVKGAVTQRTGPEPETLPMSGIHLGPKITPRRQTKSNPTDLAQESGAINLVGKHEGG